MKARELRKQIVFKLKAKSKTKFDEELKKALIEAGDNLLREECEVFTITIKITR